MSNFTCQFLFIKFSPYSLAKKPSSIVLLPFPITTIRSRLSLGMMSSVCYHGDNIKLTQPHTSHRLQTLSLWNLSSTRLGVANLLGVCLAPISITSYHYLSRVMESLSQKSLYSLTLTSQIMKGVRRCHCLRLNCRFGQVSRECPRLPCCPIVTVGSKWERES